MRKSVIQRVRKFAQRNFHEEADNMAVVDFIPRYRSKQGFESVRKIAAAAYIPSVKINWFSVHCGLRRIAHLSLIAAMILCLHFGIEGIHRIQAYLAPYLG
jgi:hypothetical protein